VAGRSSKTEAVVLRSLRFGEADRVLHLYTLERGRVGAVAKGIRRTNSRFGARLEPLSHVALVLHHGRGELYTITGVDLVRAHRPAREDPYRLQVGLVGLEAMLRLFPAEERNPRAFEALTRFLDALDVTTPTFGERAGHEPLALSFQLKLLWLSGYLPHVTSCANCGATSDLVGFSPRAGGAVCRACSENALALSARGRAAIDQLVRTPMSESSAARIDERVAREILAVVTASYEEHGGFRLRTLKSA
jgi:DNA repair protein RecO (recombination protein O)